jgi:hypothetical protein
MAFLWLFLFLRGLCAFAEGTDMKSYPSLFFNDEEMVYFYKNKKVPCSQNDLILLGILYYDKSSWSLWINDKIIHPDNVQELEGFHIEKVAPDEVEFSRLSDEGKEGENFTLQPYRGHSRKKN